MTRLRRRANEPLLTPAQRVTILNALRVGAPLKHACLAAGVPPETVRAWLHRAREERDRRAEGLPARKAYSVHLAFLADVEQADGEGAVTNVVHIANAARSGRWQAAAFLLSRKYPDEWGPPQQRVAVTIDHDDEQTDEVRSRMEADLAAMSARLGWDGDGPPESP